MIVRNEAAILERCLRSVAPCIDHYVICDTGSTDDTVAVARSVLEGAGIDGEFHLFEFLNFEQARNQALDLCRRSSAAFDYILLLDADMELIVERPRWRQRLSHPAYRMRQVSGDLTYENVRLVSRAVAARYVGATHEYLEVDGPPPSSLQGVYAIDHACGSSRAVKHERDLGLLSEALERDPTNTRTLFYLAQTLREMGRHAEAIAAYQRRIALGGWDEEAWFSRYMIARSYQSLGDAPRFIAACLEAYDARPTRAEPLHALALHYRNTGQHDACAMLCETGLRIPPPADLLFVEHEVYRTGFRNEMSISGYYSKSEARRAVSRTLTAELAVDRDAPWAVRATARSNWRFHARACHTLFEVSRVAPVAIEVPPGYRPCNPSVAVRNGRVYCVVRMVNYVVEGLRYLVSDPGQVIRTQSSLARLDGDLAPQDVVPIVEDVPGGLPDARIVGLEDIRLFSRDGALHGSCTVADRDPGMRRQMAVFDLALDGRARNLTLQQYEAHLHQKNWMPFVDEDGIGFVYWTDPTVVLRWDERSRQSVEWRRHATAVALEHQRGSSGAVAFDGGWLCLTHEVTEGGPHHRTYLHRFVHFDADFRVHAVTEPFYFLALGIEFCGGLVCGPADGLGPDQLLVSIGVDDAQAFLITLDTGSVRRRLQTVRRTRAKSSAR